MMGNKLPKRETFSKCCGKAGLASLIILFIVLISGGGLYLNREQVVPILGGSGGAVGSGASSTGIIEPGSLKLPPQCNTWQTSNDPNIRSKIPEPLSDYIRCLSRPVAFVEFNSWVKEKSGPYVEQVSRAGVMEDIGFAEYLFETAYSGREYWEKRGVDFHSVFQNLRDDVAGMDRVSTRIIENAIVAGLSGVTDMHLLLLGSSQWSFGRHLDGWFSSVVVEEVTKNLKNLKNPKLSRTEESDFPSETERVFRVVRSPLSWVRAGDVFNGPVKSLFPIPSRNGSKEYIPAVLSSDYRSHMEVSINGRKTLIPLHPCRASETTENVNALNAGPTSGDWPFFPGESSGLPLLRVRSFDSRFHGRLGTFVKSAESLRQKSAIVLDLCDNSGGSSSFSRDFFISLNGRAHWQMAGAELVSPATVQSWSLLRDNALPPIIRSFVNLAVSRLPSLRSESVVKWDISPFEKVPPGGTFKGKVAVVVNRRVGSSAEAAVSFARSVENAVLVGENTWGMGTFGEPRPYRLPNTGIVVMIPSKLFVASDLVEGRGYMPDYWIDSPDPAVEAARWLANPETYLFMPSPEPSEKVFLDFDTAGAGGEPMGVSLEIGSALGQGAMSGIEISTQAREGSGCLKLSANSSTMVYRLLSRHLPWGLEKVKATFWVKYDNVRREGGQYPNCYAGFIHKGADGGKKFNVKAFSGTNDWHQETMELDLRSEGASAGDLHFAVFLSMSGELYLDSLALTGQWADWSGQQQ
ncbi:MAG: hypothetical protein CVV64_15045 [Candidatus Wallbacteria bacterium HGW-Wallbacteria-1]|jgi:hypothetical protein|uniref:Tail specific protease domain-containing protein n=1 Tax=Candidatus Wallbacteria bacterium HGW-Wallbacteria-1 TaxID=2013854 RepID=A0A2N1PLT5_9BACT|nr:MAG: hypothetical protein CVV64_15045 [Candidatus Wallbacteria bacterium HGW-Wallbacteria-1]